MSDALVLAGAAVKGAFTAGALTVLSEPAAKAGARIDVVRIVGASAGALNGACYAAGVRGDDAAGAAGRLADLWIERATIGGSFDFSLRDIVGEVGLASADKIVELLRQAIPPARPRKPIELRLVVTDCDGHPVPVSTGMATSYEQVVDFAGADFDSAESLERLYAAAAASAALPFVFAPVTLQVDGRTVRGLDGGLVDDVPLAHALGGAAAVDRVFVIVPFPRLRTEPPNLRGIALASHITDIVIGERLLRDLDEAAHVNDVLTRLPAVVPDPGQRAAVLDALGWTGRRIVKVVEIRPDATLPGDTVSAFESRDLRQSYVQAGVAAARRALASLA
jgi:NTE family protein